MFDLMANVDPVVDPSPGTIWIAFAPTHFEAIAFDALAPNDVTRCVMIGPFGPFSSNLGGALHDWAAASLDFHGEVRRMDAVVVIGSAVPALLPTDLDTLCRVGVIRRHVCLIGSECQCGR